LHEIKVLHIRAAEIAGANEGDGDGMGITGSQIRIGVEFREYGWLSLVCEAGGRVDASDEGAVQSHIRDPGIGVSSREPTDRCSCRWEGASLMVVGPLIRG
jgi:hypothetical protein